MVKHYSHIRQELILARAKMFSTKESDLIFSSCLQITRAANNLIELSQPDNEDLDRLEQMQVKVLEMAELVNKLRAVIELKVQ